MAYLIDSDWLIDRVAGDPPAVALFDQLAAGDMRVSVVTYAEVYEGVLASSDPASHEQRLDRVIAAGMRILPFTTATAQHCARIRHDLRSSGRRTGSRALDLLVAATAIEHGLTLVTRNVNDYRDIDGLAIYEAGPAA